MDSFSAVSEIENEDQYFAAGRIGSLVRMRGELDLSAVSLLEKTIEAALREHFQLVTIDLSNVSFIDCAVLGTLVKYKKLLVGSGRDLLVQEPSRPVELFFELTGMSAYFGERLSSSALSIRCPNAGALDG